MMIFLKQFLFGISALMLEDNKKAFEKLVLDIKMDKEIKEQLERIVMSLNIDDELVTKYYDLDEERRKMNEAILEAKRKEFKEEAKKLGIKGLLEQGMIDGLEQGMKEGLEQGLKEGVTETKKLIVLNMYQENFSNEIISKATKLSLEEINEIIQQSKR